MEQPQQPVSEEQRGYPVDVTEDEFVQFSMTVAKTFGALRMQRPMLVCFVLYLVAATVFAVWDYVDTGHVSAVLIAIAAVSVLCAVPGLFVVPYRTRQAARKSYRDNSDNAYYGEITVANGEIIKLGGYKRWNIVLDETALYLEDTDFMAFTAVGGMQQVVLLPARCVTEEMAALIRQQVFAPDCTAKRRVLHRMQARAAAPIPRRKLPVLPKTLWATRFTYQPDEVKALLTDMGTRRMVKNLPVTVIGSVAFGMAFMMWLESVWAMAIAVPAAVLLAVLVSSLNAAANAKRVSQAQTVQAQVTLTERGVEFELQPLGRKWQCGWRAVERAVESDTAVELVTAGDQWIRIPKRCIDDMDELRAVVDAHRTPRKR